MDQSGGKEFRVDIDHGRQQVSQMKRATTDAENFNRAARELRGSGRQWWEVFEHNPAMYFMVDASGIVLSVNAFGASQLGYAASELVGQSLLNLVFEEDDKEFVRRKMSLCLETPERIAGKSENAARTERCSGPAKMPERCGHATS
jgi:PAS domain S-box-containing protein